MTYKKRNAIILVIVLLVLAGVCGGIQVAGRRAERTAINSAKAVLLDSAHEQAETMAALFEYNFQSLEILADSNACFTEWTRDEIEQLLSTIQERSGFGSISYIGADGIAVYGDNSGYDYSDREFFLSALNGERAMASLSGELANRSGVALAVPYYEYGETVGVLCGVYFENDLMNALTSEVYAGAGYSYIIDSSGNVVISTTSEFFLPAGQNLNDFFNSPDISFENGTDAEALLQSIRNRESVTSYFSLNDDARILATIPFEYDNLPANDWILFNVVAKGELANQISVSRNDALEAMGITAFFSLAAMLIFILLEHYQSKQFKMSTHYKEELLDNLPCGAGLYQFDGCIMRPLYLNRIYMQLVGRSCEQIEFDDAAKTIHPDDVPGLYAELKAAQAEGRNGVYELRLLTGDGSYAPFRMISHIFSND